MVAVIKSTIYRRMWWFFDICVCPYQQRYLTVFVMLVGYRCYLQTARLFDTVSHTILASGVSAVFIHAFMLSGQGFCFSLFCVFFLCFGTGVQAHFLFLVFRVHFAYFILFSSLLPSSYLGYVNLSNKTSLFFSIFFLSGF